MSEKPKKVNLFSKERFQQEYYQRLQQEQNGHPDSGKVAWFFG